MTLRSPSLEALEVDALRLDRYLDALLSAADRRTGDVPADAALDPALRRVATCLRDELVRTHPSFRFEERLAGRLADAAARMRLADVAGGHAELAVIPFAPQFRATRPAGSRAAAHRPASMSLAAAASTPTAAPPLDAGLGAVRPAGTRPLLVGGALTSAALSLAGAAFVAWRLTRRGPAGPAGRTARAIGLARAAWAARESGASAAAPPPAVTGSVPTGADAAHGHRGLA